MLRRLALCFCVLLSGLAAQSLPTGFISETVASGLSTPVGLDHLPDGRVIVIEQYSAQVKVISDTGQVGLLGTIADSSAAAGRTGLGGVVADPRWPVQPYLYFHYTVRGQSAQRVERYTVSGDLSDPASANLTLGDAFLVLDGLPDQNTAHNGSTLLFDPNGYLIVSLGDDFDDCSAQSLSSLKGCLLRLDIQGLPAGAGGPPPLASLMPLGNPFTGPDDAARLVWAYGLRNPWRAVMDTVTGDIALGDVGSSRFEEINVVTGPGQNFGWPFYEGAMTRSNCVNVSATSFVPPALPIDHSTISGPKSALALDIYRNDSASPGRFGQDYERSLFYADYFSGVIRRLEFDGSNWNPAAAVPGQPSPENWASGFFSVAGGSRGPDGALYLAIHGRGEIVRIKRGTPPRTLTIIRGDGQVADAGRVLDDPIEVLVTDPSGLPLAGVPVTFLDASGSGHFDAAVHTTDAQGRVAALYFPGEAPSQVTLSEPGGASLAVNLTWRGLGSAYGTLMGRPYLFLGLGHSERNSPLLIVGEVVGQKQLVLTPQGTVLGSLYDPTTDMFLVDGWGFYGPRDGSARTQSGAPTFQRTFWDPPLLGGVTMAFQAFAIDHQLLPSPRAFFVSNIATAYLP